MAPKPVGRDAGGGGMCRREARGAGWASSGLEPPRMISGDHGKVSPNTTFRESGHSAELFLQDFLTTAPFY